MKILVTGFKARPDEINAFEQLVGFLTQGLPVGYKSINADITFALVEDNTDTIKSELESLLMQHKPDCCVFCGQAPFRNKVLLEHTATNVRYIEQSNQPNGQHPSDFIEPDGPAAYIATLPNMLRMIEDMKLEEIPAAISHHAGNYLCNQILYLGLHYAEKNSANLSCGFLHIPILPKQVISQYSESPSMPLNMTSKALELVLLRLSKK